MQPAGELDGQGQRGAGEGGRNALTESWCELKCSSSADDEVQGRGSGVNAWNGKAGAPSCGWSRAQAGGSALGWRRQRQHTRLAANSVVPVGAVGNLHKWWCFLHFHCFGDV